MTKIQIKNNRYKKIKYRQIKKKVLYIYFYILINELFIKDLLDILGNNLYQKQL